MDSAFHRANVGRDHPADLDKIRTERLKTVTPGTINREMGFLKHVYNVAMRDGKTDRNPVARLRMLREPSGRTRYLSDDEETQLVDALPGEADRPRLQVLLNTGLRKSEFLGLRWRYVDFKAGVLTIPRSKNGAARHVPINSTVRGILSRLARPLNASALVFPNSVGGPDLRWAEKTLPEAVSAAKIEDFRLHDVGTHSPRGWRCRASIFGRFRTWAAGAASRWSRATAISHRAVVRTPSRRW